MKTLFLILALAGCLPPNYPPTAQNSADSTYMVIAHYAVDASSLGGPAEALMGHSGTAWIVGNQDGKTQLITAGHVCPVDYTITDMFGNVLHLPIVYITYDLVGVNGEYHTATATMRSDDPDLCLLESLDDLGRPMFVADAMPDYGDKVCYVGAPSGVYGRGVAPFYCGGYAGGAVITAPTSPGASGSAVWTSRGVFGVLVGLKGVTTWVVTNEPLLQFMALAGLAPGGGHLTPELPSAE